MNYIQCDTDGQLKIEENCSNYIMIPSFLKNFNNNYTSIELTKDNKKVYSIQGELVISEDECICEKCNGKMHINNHFNVKLKHLCIGNCLSCIKFQKKQYYCPNCHISKMQDIPFKVKNHQISCELYNYTCDLLSHGYTNKQVSELTGLGKNVVKDIDKERLIKLYTIDGEGKELIKPEKQARFLGIDEFKLHNGHKYATHIIDLETGHILWIAKGKKKQVVYDFINHVGLKWMQNVIAIACDMNSDFERGFKEKCPHIKIVFDYFHIVKNFNDNVVSKVRKDEQIRLANEGDVKGYKLLKNSKYILTASKDTLKNKDAKETKPEKEHQLFKDIINENAKNYENKYNEIIKNNELFFIADYIKEKLKLAYSQESKEKMMIELVDIVGICFSTGNKHFIWFGKLIVNHIDGIITHATYKISSGKIEGINNKIKTLRRQAYGYPDDEYFFLKLFDITRN